MTSPERDIGELQRLFCRLVTAPQDVERTLTAQGIPRSAVDEAFVGDARLSAVARLDIYAQMYFFRLLDVLADQYPKLAACLGEAQFHDLVTDYLVAHPPTSPSIRDAGRVLAPFVAEHRAGRDRPWLAELAGLEWAHVELFDGPDTPVLSFTQLQAMAPEQLAQLVMRPVACLRVLRFGHRIDALWDQLDPPAGDQPNAAFAPPRRAPLQLLVWRHDVAVVQRRLEPLEADALARAVDGASFGELCDWLGAHPELADPARAAFELLTRWLADELLADTVSG